MARRFTAAVGAFVLAILAVVLPGGARAQSLQRLTVDSFTLAADTSKPEIETPFHLVISLHVRQQVGEIDNLNLPILAELELQGDERRLESGAGGTQYRETITVVAHHTGDIRIAPATLQAIDARDGRAKQYFTNALTLHVTGGSLEPVQSGESFAAAAWGALVRILAWIFGIACAIAIVALVFRRRRVAAPVAVPAPAPPPVAGAAPVARTRRQQVSDALTVLNADPSRATAIRVRAAIWRMVGAPDGETLADVLQRIDPSETLLRDVLSSLERAAFTYDADVGTAIRAACASMERYLA